MIRYVILLKLVMLEACWRILEKKLQDKSHAIVRLPVHLPNEQNVVIKNGSAKEAMTSF